MLDFEAFVFKEPIIAMTKKGDEVEGSNKTALESCEVL